MRTSRPAEPGTDLDTLIDCQCGIVSRPQCLARGLTDKAVGWRLERGVWRRLHPGVYVTHSGPLPEQALYWAVVLAAGGNSALSHGSAAWLWGFGSQVHPIRITVPNS